MVKDTRPERAADSSERGEAPDFDELTPPDELVRGERTRDDFFDAVLQLDTPATVEEVAERAGHGPDAAREYLGWFERLGIVTRVTESPATYQLNRAYMTWRRVQRVQNAYDDDELVDLLGLRLSVSRRTPNGSVPSRPIRCRSPSTRPRQADRSRRSGKRCRRGKRRVAVSKFLKEH